jgi:hypothetical protein
VSQQSSDILADIVVTSTLPERVCVVVVVTQGPSAYILQKWVSPSRPLG